MLEYGNGLNPLGWISAAFAHGGFFHLAGNMFFLWGFGLVVEGKLGWRRFLPLYLAMAAGWGASVDLLTLHRTDHFVARELGCESRDDFVERFRSGDPAVMAALENKGFGFLAWEEDDGDFIPESIIDMLFSAIKGRCLGASGVIFSLLAISLVWAPKNEMHLIGFLVFRPISFDVTIMTFSLWYLGLNLFEFFLTPAMGGLTMGSSGLHVVGAVIGLAVGVVYLKRQWVDCENWDLFAVLSGKHGRFAEDDWGLGAHGRPVNTYREIPLPETETSHAAAKKRKRPHQLTRVHELINAGDVLTAADELFHLRINDPNLCPDAERTHRLALGLLKAQAWDEAEIWLQEYVDRYSEHENAAGIRIRLAQLLLTHQLRPNAALACLKGLSVDSLNEQQKVLAGKIVSAAKKQVRNGVRDAEPEW